MFKLIILLALLSSNAFSNEYEDSSYRQKKLQRKYDLTIKQYHDMYDLEVSAPPLLPSGDAQNFCVVGDLQKLLESESYNLKKLRDLGIKKINLSMTKENSTYWNKVEVQGDLHKSLFDWYPGIAFHMSGKESFKRDILRYWVDGKGSGETVTYKQAGMRSLKYKINKEDSTLNILSSYRWLSVNFIDLYPKNYVLLKVKDGSISYDKESAGGKDFSEFFSSREKITNLFDNFYSENPTVKAEYKGLMRRTKISSGDYVADCATGHGVELTLALFEVVN